MATAPRVFGRSEKEAHGWYIPASGIQSNDLVENAFAEAQLKFAAGLNPNGKSTNIVNSAASLEDVRAVVDQTMQKYEAGKTGTKARKWLHSFSQRVKLYGTVLDVMVQHHPEYVSLVWGAMKFLFTAVINHEKVISKLAEALSNIADNLPRIELAANLYPTERMQAAVAELNGYILKFLVRAHDWYREKPWKHVLHSITQPFELRYEDLLGSIARTSTVVHGLAESGQQVEFRYMHHTVDDIYSMLVAQSSELVEMRTEMSLQSAAVINTNSRLSDLQFSQIMNSISDEAIIDPMKVFNYLMAARRRTSHKPTHVLSNRFLNSPQLKRWASLDTSDVSIIKGSFRSRQAVRNFCVGVIEQIRDAQIPVIWALNIPRIEDQPAEISTIDLLRYITKQAIPLRKTPPTEKSMSLSCAPFHGNLSEADWFQLLESALAEIGRPVYLIIDLELLHRDSAPANGFSWLCAFREFFTQLARRGIDHPVKVLLISYGAGLPFTLTSSEQSGFVISTKTDTVTARQRRAGKKGNVKLGDHFRFGRIAGGAQGGLPRRFAR